MYLLNENYFDKTKLNQGILLHLCSHKKGVAWYIKYFFFIFQMLDFLGWVDARDVIMYIHKIR